MLYATHERTTPELVYTGDTIRWQLTLINNSNQAEVATTNFPLPFLVKDRGETLTDVSTTYSSGASSAGTDVHTLPPGGKVVIVKEYVCPDLDSVRITSPCTITWPQTPATLRVATGKTVSLDPHRLEVASPPTFLNFHEAGEPTHEFNTPGEVIDWVASDADQTSRVSVFDAIGSGVDFKTYVRKIGGTDATTTPTTPTRYIGDWKDMSDMGPFGTADDTAAFDAAAAYAEANGPTTFVIPGPSTLLGPLKFTDNMRLVGHGPQGPRLTLNAGIDVSSAGGTGNTRYSSMSDFEIYNNSGNMFRIGHGMSFCTFSNMHFNQRDPAGSVIDHLGDGTNGGLFFNDWMNNTFRHNGATQPTIRVRGNALTFNANNFISNNVYGNGTETAPFMYLAADSARNSGLTIWGLHFEVFTGGELHLNSLDHSTITNVTCYDMTAGRQNHGLTIGREPGGSGSRHITVTNYSRRQGSRNGFSDIKIAGAGGDIQGGIVLINCGADPKGVAAEKFQIDLNNRAVTVMGHDPDVTELLNESGDSFVIEQTGNANAPIQARGHVAPPTTPGPSGTLWINGTTVEVAP